MMTSPLCAGIEETTPPTPLPRLVHHGHAAEISPQPCLAHESRSRRDKLLPIPAPIHSPLPARTLAFLLPEPFTFSTNSGEAHLAVHPTFKWRAPASRFLRGRLRRQQLRQLPHLDLDQARRRRAPSPRVLHPPPRPRAGILLLLRRRPRQRKHLPLLFSQLHWRRRRLSLWPIQRLPPTRTVTKRKRSLTWAPATGFRHV